LPNGGRSEIYCNRNVPKLIDLIIIIIIIIIRGYSTAAGIDEDDEPRRGEDETSMGSSSIRAS